MTVLLQASNKDHWALAIDTLRKGEPVALPTETVYGLAAPALHESALLKIFSIKERPHFDPLIVHVLNLDFAKNLILKVTDVHRHLCEKFWPGPLTLLFEKSAMVPDLCTAGSQWVALRSPEHPVFRKMIEDLGLPLAAPSANRFGRISPTLAADVVKELGPRGLEAVVDGGPCRFGLESTVVKVVSDTEVEVLRPGSLAVEDIQKALGNSVHVRVSERGHGMQIESPGTAASHYAPSKKVYFIENFSHALREWSGKDLSHTALVCVYPTEETRAWLSLKWKELCTLSESGQDFEAAPKVFRTLRELDEDQRIQEIVVLKCEDQGLGRAINDRFRRAAKHRK